MPISESFREFADNYPGTLSGDIVIQMKEKGYFFSSFSNDIPEVEWETLVDDLGGEDAIDAVYNEEGSPAFIITHIETGKRSTGDGSVEALADLWLQLN
jgi:hypothetical protein